MFDPNRGQPNDPGGIFSEKLSSGDDLGHSAERNRTLIGSTVDFSLLEIAPALARDPDNEF